MFRVLYLFLFTTNEVLVQCLQAKSRFKDKDEKIILELSPDQIVGTFKSFMSSDYMQKLANEFAAQAAEHLLIQMNNTKKELPGKYSRNRPIENITTTEEPRVDNNTILDEREALTLLEAPLPDGDNLDAVTSELTADESKEKSGNTIPVIQVTKINGMYFRRLLGFM